MQQMSLSVKLIQRDIDLGTLPNYIFCYLYNKSALICMHRHTYMLTNKSGRINIKVSQYYLEVPGLEINFYSVFHSCTMQKVYDQTK